MKKPFLSFSFPYLLLKWSDGLFIWHSILLHRKVNRGWHLLLSPWNFCFSQKEISCEQFKMCSSVFAHIFEWCSHEKIFENTQEHISNCSKLISFWITKIEWFNKMSAKIEVSMQHDILLHFAPTSSSCPYVISMIIFQPLFKDLWPLWDIFGGLRASKKSKLNLTV